RLAGTVRPTTCHIQDPAGADATMSGVPRRSLTDPTTASERVPDRPVGKLGRVSLMMQGLRIDPRRLLDAYDLGGKPGRHGPGANARAHDESYNGNKHARAHGFLLFEWVAERNAKQILLDVRASARPVRSLGRVRAQPVHARPTKFSSRARNRHRLPPGRF